MNSDKMREEFEAFFTNDGQFPLACERMENGEYWISTTRTHWATWQASRAAVSIGIPKPTFLIHLDAQRFYQGQIVEFIKDQGFKCEVRK